MNISACPDCSLNRTLEVKTLNHDFGVKYEMVCKIDMLSGENTVKTTTKRISFDGNTFIDTTTGAFSKSQDEEETLVTLYDYARSILMVGVDLTTTETLVANLDGFGKI